MLREGELQAALSPLASFAALDARVGLAERRISLARGHARVPLPPGVPAALAIRGALLHGWAGPFFAGQVATLTAREPARLALVLELPEGGPRPAHALLRAPAPPGTGAVLEVSATGTGRLELPPFPPGPAELVLLVRDLAPLVRRLELDPGPGVLALRPDGGASLELLVEDPQEGTLLGPGGTLALDGHVLPWAALSEAGTCRISGVPADGVAHRLDLSLPGREPLTYWWAPGRPEERARATLRPRPALLLRATLRDRAGLPAADLPVVAAGIRVTPMGREPFALAGRTDAAGALSLAVPPTGAPGVLLLLGEGGPLGTLLTPPLEGPGPLELGALELPYHPPLQGRLLDLSLAEAAGAWVELLPAEGSPIDPGLLRRRVPVAPDGSFSFLGAANGPHLLRATAPERVGRERPLRLGPARELLEIALPRGRTLAGTVLFPGGKPAAGAQVRIQPLCQDLLPVLVSTDSEGRFRARGVPTGSVRVSAFLAHPGASWSVSVLSEAGPDEEVRLILFEEP